MPTPSPFQRLLGERFALLPEAVRKLHALPHPLTTGGRADITAAANPAAWLLCRLAGLPKPGREVPVTVRFTPDGRGREHWQRRFAGRRYASIMQAETGGAEGLLMERFGPFRLLFRLEPRRTELLWSLAGWRLLGIPLPACSLPRIDCAERGEGERFIFDISVSFPLIGPVIQYRGWLIPQEEEDRPDSSADTNYGY